MNLFEEKLSNLIRKNQIADVFPEYYKYIDAIHICEEVYDGVVDGNATVILANNKDDLLYFKKQFGWNNITLADKLNDCRDCKLLYISYNDILKNKLDYIDAGCAGFISLYEVFEENKLYFTGSFYDIYHENKVSIDNGGQSSKYSDFDPNRTFHYLKNLYKVEKDKDKRELYLRKAIFLAVYCYDFRTSFKLIDEYNKNYIKHKAEYESFRLQVEDLLYSVKTELDNRNKNDIFMFWLDQIEYGEDREMKYISSIEDSAITFDNMYTVTPYTGATLKTLYTGRTIIDGENYKIDTISKDNSDLMVQLEDRGYRSLYYGNRDCFRPENTGRCFAGNYTPISVLVWRCMTETATSETPIFSVIHSVTHTHSPFVSFDVTSSDYINWEIWPGQDIDGKYGMVEENKRVSRKYVDDQMEFWGELIPDTEFKIYMSDHGHTVLGRFHPFMKILHKGMNSKHIKELFSYCDFSKMLIGLIDNNNVDTALARGYVPIQDVDYYNRDYILHCMKLERFNPKSFFGYRGVITDRDLYIRHFNGRIVYQKNVNDEKMIMSDRLYSLEVLSGNKVPNIYTEEKFRYARLYYEAVRRNKNKYEKINRKAMSVIHGIFTNINDDDVFAIRCGGWHTLNLLLDIDDISRSKVKYVIDNDSECVASKLGVRVIHTDKIDECMINKILVSSFRYGKSIKHDLVKEYKSIEVIDLYEELEKQNIYYDHEYYETLLERQDYGIVEKENNIATVGVYYTD